MWIGIKRLSIKKMVEKISISAPQNKQMDFQSMLKVSWKEIHKLVTGIRMRRTGLLRFRLKYLQKIIVKKKLLKFLSPYREIPTETENRISRIQMMTGTKSRMWKRLTKDRIQKIQTQSHRLT